MRTMLKSKIHSATVTEANIQYEGSITIDKDLMEAADILPYEQVHVLDIDNGSRLETYVIEGERGSGAICINGAAARLVSAEDKVIIISYQAVSEADAANLVPKLVYVNSHNAIVQKQRESCSV
ncbi:MAG: aspartate 1-decarboxylase [Dehalococcoidia bacterium]